MRVGVFLEDFSPEVGGGFTIQDDIFRTLLSLIDETTHSFVLFCRKPEALRSYLVPRLEAVEFPGSLAKRSVAVAQRHLDSFRSKRTKQTRLEQLCEEARVDFMWFVGAEAVQLDLPYMAIVWDLQHRRQPWFPEVSSHGTWKLREKFYGQYLRRATYIIAGTKVGQSEIERYYQVDPARIKLLPHPTPGFTLTPRSNDQNALQKYQLEPGYLLYPAQFWSHKNHVNLLLAVDQLRRNDNIDLNVVFVGSDRGNREYIKKFAAAKTPQVKVSFLGFVPVEDLVALYKNALALTYVTFFGPENLPPLEAFALGCPVIASEVAGAREQLEDAALFVNPSDPNSIAGAIGSIVADEGLRKNLIEKGHQRAQKWTATDFVREVFQALDDFEPFRRCWPNSDQT
jgi:glycosyltransferase involved in cell wall biosynthesis